MVEPENKKPDAEAVKAAEAKAKADADAKAAAEAADKAKATEGLVKMYKDGQIIHAHPNVVGEHKKNGWKVH